MRILSTRKVMELTGLSRSTIWRLEKRGAFPQSIPLSPGRKGYSAAEVNEWLVARAGARQRRADSE